jgi:hypothetical protein
MSRGVGHVAFAVIALSIGCDNVLGLVPVTESPAPDASMYAPITSGLVAWYPMDTIAAAAASCMPDATGHGHDGACIGDTPLLEPGVVGSAYSLDGATTIRIRDAVDLDSTAAFTIALWLRLPTLGSAAQCPINRPFGTAVANSWQLCLTGMVTYFNVFDGMRSYQRDQPSPLSAGAWHHVGLLWDGSNVSLWIAGAKIIELAGAVTFDTNDIVIGADIDQGIPNAPYLGLLDDVRIYDRALTADEMHQLANE